jgi:hypothetical protein
MKKIILVLSILISVLQWSWAQNYKFQLGVDGGPSIAMYTGGAQSFEVEAINSYSFSGTAQFNFNSKLAIVSGLAYEQKGYIQTPKEYYIRFLGFDEKYRVDLRFLNLPVMVRYTIGNGKFKGYGNLGGYLGFLVNSRVYEVGTNYKNGYLNTNAKKLENIDFGVVLGLGLSYELLKRLCVTFELRDNYGLYYLNSSQSKKYPKSQLNSVNFLFGVNYGLGAKD